MVIKDANISSILPPKMGKSLTYDDLEKIITVLQLELADYKKIEAGAQAVFNHFKQVAERLQSGIYRYDIKSHRFLFFNRLVIELLGSKESEAADITSASVFLRIHPNDREMVRRKARESKASGKDSGEAEYRYLKKDDTYRWIYDRWVVLRDSCGTPRYIEGIIMDTTDRKLSEEALKESQYKLRSLSFHLLEAQEKARRRMALELHDDLGQALMVLKLKLRSIKKALPADSRQVLETCENANNYVDRIIENVRHLSHELCPSTLEDLGLDESIVLLAEDFSKHTNLLVFMDIQNIDALFGLKARTLIYRIFQEALTNIQKHAQSRRVWIKITIRETMVDIHIADDGNGFVKEQSSTGNRYRQRLGLTAMEERARMLDGKMRVYSIIGIGTRLAFMIPIERKGANDEFLSFSIG
ncbi:PAS domain-containing protein [Desulfococcus sp.]|uniref:PAS domain-containing sensor histidine kinase n=1 Tax=Desulfococcus sp. TaxID=2025834 RepID=UPI0035938AF9